MSKIEMKDERVIAARRKIQSDGFQIVWMVLILSNLVQQYFLRAPFSQYAVEFFGWIGCGIYVLVCNYKEGLSLNQASAKTSKKIFLGSVITGILGAVFFGFLSGEDGIQSLLTYFVCFVAVSFGAQILIGRVYAKKQEKLCDELDREQSDD